MAKRNVSRIGSDWFNECAKMFSYKGGGIPFNQAKRLLSPVWDEGKQLGLEGDELCRYALEEVQPALDEYLREADKPLRKTEYYPTGFPQQYGLQSGEKKTLWRYNPIREFPELESLPSTLPRQVTKSPNFWSNYYFPSKPTDRPPTLRVSPIPVGPARAAAPARPAAPARAAAAPARPSSPARPVGAGARPRPSPYTRY